MKEELSIDGSFLSDDIDTRVRVRKSSIEKNWEIVEPIYADVGRGILNARREVA